MQRKKDLVLSNEQLTKEVARLTLHSVALNSVAWRLANLLEFVEEGETVVNTDRTPLMLLEEYAIRNEVALLQYQNRLDASLEEIERLRTLLREVIAADKS